MAKRDWRNDWRNARRAELDAPESFERDDECADPPNSDSRHSDSASEPRYPAVAVQNRLFNILGVDPVELDDLDSLSYSWDHGYERLTATREGGGTLEFQGAYHPGDGCCVGNPCDFCGKVWHE